MRAYMEDQRREPFMRTGAPCPWPWVVVQLAERFHVLPWAIEEEPADRVLFYIALLSIEGEYRRDTAGMGPGDAFYDFDE